jgi:hypothetical protein
LIQDKVVINPSYYCERNKPGGTILVYTANAYVVAEYEEQTGNAKWQRVVNAAQKADIEKWLAHRFPKSTGKAKEQAAK